jgi:hypothetical protein
LATQVYARLIVQIDVKDNAKRLAEISIIEQRRTGMEQPSSKPFSLNSRFTPMRIDGSLSTTKIELRVNKMFGLRVLSNFSRARSSAGSKNAGRPCQ